MKLTSHRPDQLRDRWVSAQWDWEEAKAILEELNSATFSIPIPPRRLERLRAHLETFLGAEAGLDNPEPHVYERPEEPEEGRHFPGSCIHCGAGPHATWHTRS